MKSLEDSHKELNVISKLDIDQRRALIDLNYKIIDKDKRELLIKFTREIVYEINNCLVHVSKNNNIISFIKSYSDVNTKNSNIINVINFMKYFLNFYKKDYYEDLEVEPKIKFKWRDNQKKAIDTVLKNNFITGIHSQATGTGKSMIALKIINEFNKKYSQKSVLWFCERKDIPRKLFLDNNNNLKKENIKFWKDNDIIDMSKFNFFEFVETKKDLLKIWNDDYKKPLFILINRAYLTKNSKDPTKKYIYQEIIKNKPELVILDECHSATSHTTYKFLNYAKYNWGSKIQGFSATPYRKGKSYTAIDINLDFTNSDNINDTIDLEVESNGEKLIKIFNKPDDVNTLNILSWFNLREAIEQGIILEPVFHWYSIEKIENKENKKIKKYDKKYSKYSKEEIKAIMKSLNHVLGNCAYKKAIVWGRLTENSDDWKNIFDKEKNKYKNLKNLESFISHSKLKRSDTNYNIFYEKKDNCIMFCANQFKEGSDIPYLTMGVFLDKVKNRGEIPFIQCIGRVLRKDGEDDFKKNGHILDGFVDDSGNMTNQIVQKIIKYYLDLYEFSKSNIEDFKKKTPNYKVKTYSEILKTLKYDSDKKQIKIKLKNDKNITIDIGKLDMSSLKWNKIIVHFKKEFKKIMAFQKHEEYLEFQKQLIDNNIRNKDDYNKKWKQLELSKNCKKIDPIEFQPYFTNWYDMLKIDTSKFIKDIEEWRRKCFKKNITWKYYSKKSKNYEDLPDMPEEFYPDFGTIMAELNKNKIRNNRILIKKYD